jgi:hypothetical protein
MNSIPWLIDSRLGKKVPSKRKNIDINSITKTNTNGRVQAVRSNCVPGFRFFSKGS